MATIALCRAKESGKPGVAISSCPAFATNIERLGVCSKDNDGPTIIAIGVFGTAIDCQMPFCSDVVECRVVFRLSARNS